MGQTERERYLNAKLHQPHPEGHEAEENEDDAKDTVESPSVFRTDRADGKTVEHQGGKRPRAENTERKGTFKGRTAGEGVQKRRVEHGTWQKSMDSTETKDSNAVDKTFDTSGYQTVDAAKDGARPRNLDNSSACEVRDTRSNDDYSDSDTDDAADGIADRRDGGSAEEECPESAHRRTYRRVTHRPSEVEQGVLAHLVPRQNVASA